VAGFLSGLSRFGQRPVVALSIEGNDLRLICVSGREIVRLVAKPLPPDAMPGGVVADPAVFGSAVRTILNEYEIPHGTVVVGFPDVNAISKMLTLPTDASTKVADVVVREARRDPVIGQGDYRVFHQIVAQSPVQITVFLLAVRRTALTHYLDGLRLAGIAPQMVELRPLAMIRAINQPHTIIANAERPSLDVIVVSNNLPVIMRSVPLSGNDTEFVQEVVHELELTIESYNSQHQPPLNSRLPIALTGELSATPDLQQAVQERLGHPIATLACPFTGPGGFAVANFIVNIGLVLKTR
jgi:Tfp pilus assembly PilM family ATPase